MLQFSEAQLMAWIAGAIYPFFRVLGLVASAPVLGNSSVPRRVRIGLALFVTVVVAPSITAVPAAPLVSGDGLVLVARQLLVGIAMGFAMRLAFAAVEYAGDLIGLQMGIGFATLVSPDTNDQSPIIGTMLGYFTMLAFLAANGPLLLVAGVADSFDAIPIANDGRILSDWRQLVAQGSALFGLALHMALPIIAALLITNVALGVMTRAAPQLNVFSIGFPITIGVGLLVLLVSLPVVLAIADRAVLETAERLLR